MVLILKAGTVFDPRLAVGAVPVVVLTKSDLVEDCTRQIEAARQIAIGVEVFAVSAVNGSGFDALAGYLSPGKRLFFSAPQA